MEKITFLEFKQDSGKAEMVLISIMIYSIYKIFVVDNVSEYVIISASSLMSIVCVMRLYVLGERKISDKEFKLSFLDSLLTGNIIIMLLGALSFYIFFVKGLYGLYKLWNNFSWTGLAFRLIIIILTCQLVASLARLQSVYLSIEGRKLK